MRYYKYPHHSVVVMFSALWLIFSLLVLIGWMEISLDGFAVAAIIQAGIIMLLRLIDAGRS